MDWSELPDYDKVRDALKAQARLKADLRVAELELEIAQAELVRIKPRDSSVKLIGIDEESKQRLHSLHLRVIVLRAQLDELDADVKFNDYVKDAAKVMSYKGRF